MTKKPCYRLLVGTKSSKIRRKRKTENCKDKDSEKKDREEDQEEEEKNPIPCSNWTIHFLYLWNMICTVGQFWSISMGQWVDTKAEVNHSHRTGCHIHARDTDEEWVPWPWAHEAMAQQALLSWCGDAKAGRVMIDHSEMEPQNPRGWELQLQKMHSLGSLTNLLFSKSRQIRNHDRGVMLSWAELHLMILHSYC